MKRTYDWFHTNEVYSGINQTATQSFVCSPNPANQLVYVQIDSPTATTFVLTDLSGKTVAQQSNTSANNQLQINTQNLAQGTYLGYFANAKGQAVSATQKITVIH
jgi:ABC-type amino acid transport substrate-binding protein